jgi:hypothetical protein
MEFPTKSEEGTIDQTRMLIITDNVLIWEKLNQRICVVKKWGRIWTSSDFIKWMDKLIYLGSEIQ